MNQRVCWVDGCGKPARYTISGPICDTHYSRYKRHGSVHLPPRSHLVDEWRSHVVETDTGCLEWTRYRDRNGYAKLGRLWAHRLIFEVVNGPIPDGYELDHTCNNPPCVNPAHLEPVDKIEHTRRTNERSGLHERHKQAALLRSSGLPTAAIAEKLGYSISGVGSAVASAVSKGFVDAAAIPQHRWLTDAERLEIQQLRADGLSMPEIAARYGIHSSHASRVSRGLGSRRFARKTHHLAVQNRNAA